MRIFFVLTISIWCVACQKKEELPAPAVPKNSEAATSSGYLGAIGRAKESMEKNIDTTAINNAIQLFNAQEGRNPQNLEELVSRNYIGKIPLPPSGMNFQYDAIQGKVTLVPASAR